MKKKLIQQNFIQKKQLDLYVVLAQLTSYFLFIFTINIRISTYFVYYKYMNHDKKQLLKKALLFLKQQFTKHINGKYDINKN